MHKRILTIVGLFFAGVILTASYALFAPHHNAVNAQSRPAEMNPTNPAPMQRQQPRGQSRAKMNEIDRMFFEDAAKAGVGNIQLSQLALKKSNSSAVKEFANAEIQEQIDVKNSLTKIAPKMGMTLPTTPMDKQKAAFDRLSKLSGSEFEQAFMDEGGVNAHLDNAALFQREAAFGENPDLVAVANKGLPIIQRHFGIASNATNYKFAQVRRNYNEVASVPRQ
jgi:putative membrane protein